MKTGQKKKKAKKFTDVCTPGMTFVKRKLTMNTNVSFQLTANILCMPPYIYSV